MTVIEIKTEIKKLVDEVPEESLTDILNFLKEFKNKPVAHSQQSDHFKDIMDKHRGLLKKLAQ